MNVLLSREPPPENLPRASSTTAPHRGPLWLGTSWKMTKTLAESRRYVEEFGRVPVPAGVQVFLLPPLTALHAVRAALPPGSPLLVGVQNAHWAADGPVTGEVSMHQVRDAGAQIVEIGHSERRAQFGETDQVVAAKVAAALDQHLVPLVCVGEPESARATHQAIAYVTDQVRAALSGVAAVDLPRVLIAYEPVWAIGDKGRPASPSHVAAVLAHIRALVAGLAPGAQPRGLLYGGSVSTANAGTLLGLDDVDGLFVGRAAWTADGLAAILALCGRAVIERDEGRSAGAATPAPGSPARGAESAPRAPVDPT